MNAIETTTLATVKSLAKASLISTHPDMNFGIVMVHEIPSLLVNADTCVDNGVGLFTVCATDADGVRIAIQVSLIDGGVYVHGAGELR